MASDLFRVKSVEQSIADTEEPEHKLKKDLSVFDLMVFGVGVIIGTGIFVLTGKQAALNAGPGIVFSFLIAALVCALAAMCYAEFASTVPVAGSAYTFSYATLGEIVAWIIGWDLGTSRSSWRSVPRWSRVAGRRTSSICLSCRRLCSVTRQWSTWVRSSSLWH